VLACATVAIYVLALDTSLRNVFDLTKAAYTHGLAWVVLSVLLIVAASEGVRVPASPLFLGFYGVIAVDAVTTATATNQYVALYGEVGRYLGLTTHLVLALLAVAIAVGLEYPLRVRWLAIALAAVSLAAAGYGLMQAAGADPIVWVDRDSKARPFATLGNPDFYGQFLSAAVISSAAVALFSGADAGRWRWSAAVLGALSAVLLVLTATRGAVIGVIAGVVVLGVLWLRRTGATRSALARVSLAAVGFAGTIGLVILTTPLGDRLVALTDVANIQDRVLIYTSATRIFLDHPVLGVGFENFAVAYPRYEEAEGIKNNRTQTSAHNWILHIAATTGLAGLLSTAALLVAFAVHVWRRARDSDATALLAAAAGLSAYYASGLVLPGAQSIQWIPWACVGVALASELREARVIARLPPLRLPVIAKIAILASLAALALPQETVIAANRAAKTAESSLRAETARRAVDAARAATAADPGRAVYWNDLGRALELVDDQSAARTAYLEATARSPYTPAFWWNLGRMHLFFARRGEPGAKEATYEAFRRGLEASPRNPDTLDQLARAQLALGDNAEALASEERAIALYPGDPRYYTVAADAARQLGETTRSLDLLRAGIVATDSNDLRLTLARRLIDARSENEARSVLRDILQREPTNAAAAELLKRIGE
jgi:O-antigen ligase/Flp pilus assembly protein TadD